MTQRSWRWFATTIGLLYLGAAQADPAALILDEPQSMPQPGVHRVQVFDDGSARVHLKLGTGELRQPLEFSLTPFKADGQPPVAVAFDAAPGTPLLPYLHAVTVPAGGSELHLKALALSPDVEYTGHLLATAGDRTFIWDLTLIRTGALPPFVCPANPLILSADGSTTVQLRRAAPSSDKSLMLRLSLFTTKEQELGDVGMLVDPAKNLVKQQWPNFPLAEGETFQVPFRSAGLTEGGVYSGQLAFLVGERELMHCALTFQMPKLLRGELTATPPSISRTIMKSFWGATPDEPVSVILSDKSRAHRIDGIAATLDGTSESPNGSIDPVQDLQFTVDGTTVKNFTRLQVPVPAEESPSRTLLPGALMSVGLQLVHPQAGRYAFSLRFSALNGGPTPPKVDVAINVRDNVMWAVITLVVALLCSFFITKGIVNWRERARVRARVAELRQQSFTAHSDLPTAVFMRAVLDQTETLLKPIWFVAPPPSVYDFLKRAEWAASILASYAALREALSKLSIPQAKPHYADAIAEIMRRIGPRPLDQKTTDGIVNDLGVLQATMSDPQTWYFATLKSKAKALLQEAQPLKDGPADSAVMTELLTILSQPPAEPNGPFDDAYWIVKLLVSRRPYDEDLKAITAAYKVRKSREDVFKKGDQLAWARLEKAVDAKRVSIAIADRIDPLEALRPTKLVVQFDDVGVGQSYLVRNVLEYVWRFESTEEPAKRCWSETSKGARTTQYMRRPGKLTARVCIRWPGADEEGKARELEAEGPTFEFEENSEVRLANNVSGSDLLLLGIVFVITLLTALPTLYYGKPAFGSFADYVAILAWAIGVDQGRILLQLMKSFPSDSPSSSP